MAEAAAPDRARSGSGGSVAAIWVKRVRRGPMDPVDSARLEAGRGLANNANQGGKRQVTLIEREVWDLAANTLDPSLTPDVRRANIMLAGIDLQGSRGRVLRLGDSRILIHGETRPCRLMEETHPGLQAFLAEAWRGGAFAEVLDAGEIRVGDSARWEDDRA